MNHHILTISSIFKTPTMLSETLHSLIKWISHMPIIDKQYLGIIETFVALTL